MIDISFLLMYRVLQNLDIINTQKTFKQPVTWNQIISTLSKMSKTIYYLNHKVN